MLVLAIVGIVIGVTVSGGSSSKPAGAGSSVPVTGSLALGFSDAASVNRLLSGIPQSGNVLGSPSAPVTIVEYIDLQCPYCQAFETQALAGLLAKYVRTDKAKLEARPIVIIGPDSDTGRRAAIAAGEQNRMFNFMQLLYDNQGSENTGWLNETMITSAAESIPGLNIPELLNQQNSNAVKSQANQFDQDKAADAVIGTPTIFVGKSSGPLHKVTLTSVTDASPIETAINSALG